jgi:galactonate dehydratase
LKISDIKTWIVRGAVDNWVFVKVYTDEGIYGVGECSMESKENTVTQAVLELSDYLVGENPFQIELHAYRIYRDGYWGAAPVLMSALSAIDCALWDIKGKALGIPVFELLGGQFRSSVRIYANRWFFGASSDEELAEKACAVKKAGITGAKWDPFGKASWTLSNRELEKVTRSVQAVRDAVGPDFDVIIEGHGRFNARSALTVAQALAPYKPLFFEEPIMPENLTALAEVRSRSPIPVAAGERLFTKFDFRQAFELNALDIAQPDLRYTGGITEAKKIASLAEAFGIQMAPHNIHGQIGTAATLQLLATIPNFLILEFDIEDIPWLDELFMGKVFKPQDGDLKIPAAPGLGIDFDEKVAEKYPYQRQSMIQEMFE